MLTKAPHSLQISASTKFCFICHHLAVIPMFNYDPSLEVRVGPIEKLTQVHIHLLYTLYVHYFSMPRNTKFCSGLYLHRRLVPPYGGLHVELLSGLQKSFRLSDPDTMTNTALEATAAPSGNEESPEIVGLRPTMRQIAFPAGKHDVNPLTIELNVVAFRQNPTVLNICIIRRGGEHSSFVDIINNNTISLRLSINIMTNP